MGSDLHYPIRTTLQASPDVRAMFGLSPRVYRFGEAPDPDRITLPYVVWQIITAAPENHLSGTPGIDRQSVQIDVYAATDSGADAAGKLVRDTLEAHGHCLEYRTPPRDPETRLYRVSLDFDLFLER
jgi:hypothetical protein